MFTETELFSFLKEFLRTFSYSLASELTAAAFQEKLTSKRERKEKCVAFLLESFTGRMDRYPSEQWVIACLNTVETIRANCITEEAKVGLNRAEKRLRYALDNQDKCISNQRPCVACGQPVLFGKECPCNTPEAKARDSQLARDPDIYL